MKKTGNSLKIIGMVIGGIIGLLVLAFGVLVVLGPIAPVHLPPNTSIIGAHIEGDSLISYVLYSEGKPVLIHLVRSESEIQVQEETTVTCQITDKSTAVVNGIATSVLMEIDLANQEHIHHHGTGYKYELYSAGEVLMEILTVSPIPDDVQIPGKGHYYFVLTLDNGITTISETQTRKR